MSNQDSKVMFRRIHGRIVPIKVKTNLPGAPEIQIGQQRRGPYTTKKERRNIQRRERYRIRKELQEKRAKEKKEGRLFGIRGLSWQGITASVGLAGAAFSAIRGGRLGALKGLARYGVTAAEKAAGKTVVASVTAMRKANTKTIANFYTTRATLRSNPLFSPKMLEAGAMRELQKSIRKGAKKAAVAPNIVDDTAKLQRALSRHAHAAEKLEGAKALMRGVAAPKTKVLQSLKWKRKTFKKLNSLNDKYGFYADVAGGAVVGAGGFVGQYKADE